MSGNRARALAIAAVNGLGMEGAGVLAPGTLNPDFIQATRDQSQGGFGAYSIPEGQNDVVILTGVPGSTCLVVRGIFPGPQGYANTDKETRVVASSCQLNLDAAGVALLVAASAQLEVRLEISYGQGLTGVLCSILYFNCKFIAGKISYQFTLNGGGTNIGIDNLRLDGSWLGWVPADCMLQWSVYSRGLNFPANSSFQVSSVVVQQPRFNRVPL